MAKRGQPITTYSTATGDFRLTEDTAKRRGLIPDGDRLPPAVARRLRTEGRLSLKQVDKVAAAYGDMTDAKRAEALEAVAMARPRDLRAVAGDTFRGFNPDKVETETADLSLAGRAHTEAERPPAPTEANAEPATTDTAALLEGRVGDVTDHLDRVAKAHGDDAAKAAAAELLTAERAGKGRKSLLGELERRAG